MADSSNCIALLFLRSGTERRIRRGGHDESRARARGVDDRRCTGSSRCPRRRLSVPADHADPAARRRRRHGHPGARAVRAEAQGAARQADRHREPHRRRHGDRRDRDGEGGARRLHAVHGAGRHAHHQRHALQEAALRSGQGFHADRADLVGGLRAGGPSVAAGSFGQGARGIRQGAARASWPSARPASARRRISRSR